MNRSLTIALLGWTPGWEILLEWIGVPWRPVVNLNELTKENFAVAITNRHLWRDEVESVEGFVREGGGVLDIGSFLHRIRPEEICRGWLTSVFPDQADPLFSQIPLLDLDGRGISTRHGWIERGLLGYSPLGSGRVASLGIDPGAMMENHIPRTKRFPGIDGRHPAERVARLSKGEVGLLVERILASLFAEGGLPMIRKRSFPEDAENIFCFRVDSDYGKREQIDALYDVAHSTSTPMTWFIHTEGHTGWLSRFAEFENQEIALHCARHRTFPDKERNRTNIREARRALQEAGMEVKGYAAPNGIWHHNLAEVIDEEGFAYSTEFTLACDAFPFHPILPLHRRVNNHFYRTLQVPIHPVSVGNLARVGIPDERMVDYYRGVIDRKIQTHQSIIFYHHPTHERWDVVEGIIESGRRKGVRFMSFGEYANWWQLRERAQIEGSVEGDQLFLRSREREKEVHVDILFPDGTTGQIQNDGQHGMTDISRRSPHEFSSSQIPQEKIDHLRNFSFTVARRALRDYLIRIRR